MCRGRRDEGVAEEPECAIAAEGNGVGCVGPEPLVVAMEESIGLGPRRGRDGRRRGRRERSEWRRVRAGIRSKRK